MMVTDLIRVYPSVTHLSNLLPSKIERRPKRHSPPNSSRLFPSARELVRCLKGTYQLLVGRMYAALRSKSWRAPRSKYSHHRCSTTHENLRIQPPPTL